MELKFAKNYETISKEDAFQAFCKGEQVMIGRKKSISSFWTLEQFADKAVGQSKREQFDSIVAYIKKNYMPFTRTIFAKKAPYRNILFTY